MNIIEAVESGKKFKRLGHDSWIRSTMPEGVTLNTSRNSSVLFKDDEGAIRVLSKESFLATDWFLQKECPTCNQLIKE